MTRISILLLCISLTCYGQSTLNKPEPSVVAIKDVTIIDIRNGDKLKGYTILVSNNKIVSLLPSSETEIPQNSKVIDAIGKYAIPGLWDVHTHIHSQDEIDLFYPLLIAHGVLGIRNVGGLLPSEFSKGAKRHKYIPTVVAAGPMVNGDTPEGQAPAAIVDSLVAKGVDFIKIQSAVPLDRLKAIAKRADELGTHIAGHVPYSINVGVASDLGLRTLEHYLEMYVSISDREPELRKDHVALIEQEYSIGTIAFPPLEPRVSSWNDEKAYALFERLKANGTWIVPTHITIRAWAESGSSAFWEDERLLLLPESWLEFWKPENHFGFKKIPKEELPEYYKHIGNWYRAYLQLTKKMNEHGVKFLAGTDASFWNFQIPGASLQEELIIFVEAGLNPLQAIQTATINVADYLKLKNYDGTISTGQMANFLLLDGDPLMDIRSITKIFLVVSNGNFIDKNGISNLLKAASSVVIGD